LRSEYHPMKTTAFHILILLFLSKLMNSLIASPDYAGLRDVQVRSDHVVTAWLGYLSTTDVEKLYDTENYLIGSSDDPAYKTEVHPSKISRFMKGSRTPDGNVDWRALQDQLMHLQVQSPFQKGFHYYIRISEKLLPRDVSRTGEFSLQYTPNPSFKVNQVGYNNQTRVKYIYLSSYLGDGDPVDLNGFETFSIINATTKETVLSGAIELVSESDLQGKDKLYRMDISSLQKEGYFYAEIEGLGRSYVFQNGDQSTRTILETVGRGMYFQRCGAELVPPYCGKWPRGLSHHKIWVTPKNIVHPWDIEVDPTNPAAGDYYVPDGPREIRGGHHDAGDYDTRLTHHSIPEQFLSLYEQFPEKFHDGQIFIPEESNGIPDILDEAAWNLLHYEYLQDYFAEVRGEFGAIPGGMESWKHPPQWPMQGHGDALPYFMRKATPYTTFCESAVFAQAARVFEPFDKERASRYLHRALAGYKWAEAHKDMQWSPENPKVLPLDWEEVYDEEQLDAAWSFAAAQLFETTGEDRYMQAFATHFKTASKTTQDKLHSFWPIIASKRTNVDKVVQQDLRNQLLASAEEWMRMWKNNSENGYAAFCPNKGGWGFANPIANIEIPARAYMLTREQRYLDAISTSVDFMLGMNPSEICWMTGVGSVSPVDPLHANSSFDGEEDPVPGLVAYGPNDNWNHKMNPLYPDPENMGFYRRIADVWGYVEGCEFVTDDQLANMYWAAGLLLE